MKRFTLFLMLVMCVAISFPAHSQTKKELNDQITKLRSDIQALKEENISLRSQLNDLSKNSNQVPVQSNSVIETPTTSPGRCLAITAKGTQCSRNADPGSSYCWQHKRTYEPTKTTESKESPSGTSVTPKTSSGSGSYGGSKTIQTGPRGGKYYINKNGNKTYIKK